jgi:hypothetical protein
MIRFTCECGRELNARDEDAGKRITCRDCGRQLLVPDDRAGVVPAEEVPRREAPSRAVRAGRPDEPYDEEEPRRRRREDEEEAPRDRVPSGTSGKAIFSLVLGLVSFACTLLTGVPAIILGVLALGDIKRSRGRLGGQALAIGGIITGAFGIFLLIPALLLVPAVWKVREAAARVQSQNNLKMMALSFHNHQDQMGRMPPAAIRSPDGRPLLSWRVAILPYLEQEALYRQFRLDEPWDSPHNKRLLSQMPRVYALPGDDPATGMTHYRVFVGPRTPFEDPRGPKITDFTDGTANTFLIVEAADAVPWTKPDELTYTPGGPLPRLGGRPSAGFNAALADGSVYFVPDDLPPSSIEALITARGGEAVPNWPPRR